jgi:hypothetical protein
MLNGLVAGYASMRALSVVSMMLVTVDPTGQTHTVAYAHSDKEATEQSRGRAETVCVLAETVRRQVVTFTPSCKTH